MKAPARAVVAWWYSPTAAKWIRWSSHSAPSAGDALELAMRALDWMPEGDRFVDVWRRAGGAWKHETRYRGGEA